MADEEMGGSNDLKANIVVELDFDKQNAIKQVDESVEKIAQRLTKKLSYESKKRQSKSFKIINVDTETKRFEKVVKIADMKYTKLSWNSKKGGKTRYLGSKIMSTNDMLTTFGSSFVDYRKKRENLLIKQLRKEASDRKALREKQRDVVKNSKLDSAVKWAQAIGSNLTGEEKEKATLNYKNQELKDLQSKFTDLNQEYAMADLDSQLNNGGKPTQRMTEIQNEIDETTKKAAALNKEIKNIQNNISSGKTLSSLQKLLNTIKRVGFYRIARNLFRYLESGAATGIRNVALFDPSAAKTMSTLSTAFEEIQNSVGLIIMPLLQAAEPLIKGIADGVSMLANAISYLGAKFKGSATYTKIATDRLKEYNQQSNLSFDKFESLDAQQGVTLTEGNTSEGLFGAISNPQPSSGGDGESGLVDSMKSIADEAERIGNTLGGFAGILTGIAAIGIVKWVMAGGITGLLTTIGLIGGVLLAIGSYKLFDGLLSEANQTQSFLVMILGLILSIGMAILAITAIATGQLVGALLAAAGFMVGMGMLIAGAKNVAQKSVEMKANGGLVDTGTLFVAGESGAEVVSTMQSGQTGVTNVSQFKQAMLEALYEWSSSSSQDGEDIVLNLDGAEVARSRRFKQEINRTNANLKLQ